MRCISIVRSLYILESFRLFSTSHFCLLKLQHLLTYKFLSDYHGLWCAADCWEWFCIITIIIIIIIIIIDKGFTNSR
jgi:hypothetical protein